MQMLADDTVSTLLLQKSFTGIIAPNTVFAQELN